MSRTERKGAVVGLLLGLLVGYFSFVYGDVSFGSVLAAAIFGCAASAASYFFVRWPASKR